METMETTALRMKDSLAHLATLEDRSPEMYQVLELILLDLLPPIAAEKYVCKV